MSWLQSLGYFQRTVVECGLPVGVEHAQRIGLLFTRMSPGAVVDRTLPRWAALFEAEDVAPCAMLLQALVRHQHMRTAKLLLDSAVASRRGVAVGELLARFLVAHGHERRALALVVSLARRAATQAAVDTPCHTAASSRPAARSEAMRDAYGLAHDPHYVPRGECAVQCGYASAVARALPHRRQWQVACALLSRLVDVAVANGSEELHVSARVLWATRLTYAGEQHARMLAWAHAHRQQCDAHATLLRCELRSALARRDVGAATRALATLRTAHGVVSLPRVGVLRARALALSCGAAPVEAHTRTRLVDRAALLHECTRCSDALRSPSAAHPCAAAHATLRQATVTSMDHLASLLVRRQRWCDALAVMQQACTLTPRDSAERVMVATVAQALCEGDWQRALCFVT